MMRNEVIEIEKKMLGLPIALQVRLKSGNTFDCFLHIMPGSDPIAVRGIIKSGHVPTAVIVEDAHWDDMYVQAEEDAIGTLKEHLSSEYPDMEIEGEIASTFVAAYHPERSYSLQTAACPKS